MSSKPRIRETGRRKSGSRRNSGNKARPAPKPRNHPHPPASNPPTSPSSPSTSSARTPVPESHRAYLHKLSDYALLLEYKRIQEHVAQGQLSGVYVMPTRHSLREWDGVIFVRSGLYAGGIFKFVVDLTKYESTGPNIFFHPAADMFSPLIDPQSGRLDLSIMFPKWDANIHFIALALNYAKTVFYNEHYWETRMRHAPHNRKADELWQKDKHEFARRAQQCARLSQRKVYASRNNAAFTFKPQEHNHGLVQQRILRSTKERKHKGFSFLDWFSDGVANLSAWRPGAGVQDMEDGSAQRGTHSREIDEDDDTVRRSLTAEMGAAADEEEEDDDGELPDESEP